MHAAVQAHRRWHQRARHALRRSLGIKLVVVFLVVGLTMVVIFVSGTQRALGTGFRLAVAPLLGDYVDRLVAEIGSPLSIERAQALTQRLPLSVRITGPRVQWSSSPGHHEHELDDSDQAQDRHWHGSPGRQGMGGLLRRQTPDGHTVTLGLGELPWRDEPSNRGWLTLLLLLLVIALAYGYLRRLLRPLDDIRAGAARFGRGEFERPIEVRRHDELGELAAQVNTMAGDIHQMLEGKRALLLAISHELRSPLTRARLNAELLPTTDGEVQPRRDALLRDLEEMRDLITDLLETERLSGAHVALQREPVDVAALVHDVVAARSDARPAVLDLPTSPVMAHVDPSRLRLAVRNLVDNAQRHGGDAEKPVQVTVLPPGEDGRVELQVRDYGPGVEDAHLARLAEAFYRPETARTRAGGGVGLGLYLTRLVAQAHGGQLRLRNAQPGLEARITF